MSVKVADWPALMVPEVGEAESEKSFVVLEPVPVRLTDCGLPEALSVMLRVPVRVPDAVGVNVRLMVQLAPAATELPQVLVWAKSPLAETLVRFSEALPVLESVTDCAALVVPTGWLANVSEEAERLTTGAEAAAPVPVKLTDCGLPEALSVMLRVPVRVPDAVGVNVTLMVQLAPAATELPQVLVWAKSPLAETLVRFSEALPVLESVTDCAALVVPTVRLAKASEEAERLTTGAEAAAPVPVRLTDCGLPEALSVILRPPDRVPEAVGVNVTLMVQFAPAATELPQLLVCAKSPLFVPVTAMLVRFSEALPVFESVTVCAALVVPTVWLVKVNEEAERLTTGAEAAAPVPVRLTDCGLPEVLSAMLKVPVRVPDAVGVNVVLIVQFAPTATELPQVSVSA